MVKFILNQEIKTLAMEKRLKMKAFGTKIKDYAKPVDKFE